MKRLTRAVGVVSFVVLINVSSSFVSPSVTRKRVSNGVKPLPSDGSNSESESTTKPLVTFEAAETLSTITNNNVAAAASTVMEEEDIPTEITMNDEIDVVDDKTTDISANSKAVVEGLEGMTIQMDEIDYGGYSLNGYTDTTVYKNSLQDKKPSLLSRTTAYNLEEFNEDGYGDMRTAGKRSIIDKALKLPFRILQRISNGKKVCEPGALILVRHGESVWNANKTFTGWSDPDLSVDGVREVEHAARLLLEGGWEIDLVFTSRLKRAIRSAWIILQELNEVYLPVFKSWRLNER